MAKFEKQKCVHCLQYFDVLTKDHVFPDSWYPESSSLGLEKWTVPACQECNNRLGTIEEEVLNILSVSLDENELGAQGLNTRINNFLLSKDEKNIGRSIKFLMDLINNTVPYIYEKGNDKVLSGLTPKDGIRSPLMIRTPYDKLLKVSEKIIRGLEYVLRNRLIEEDRMINIIIPHENNEKELEYINNWQKLILPEEENIHRGHGFVVKYGVSSSDDNWVIYNVKIWNHINIWAFVAPKNKIQKKQSANRTKSNELINEATNVFRQKKLKESIRLINLSIETDPTNFYAYYTKAGIYYEIDDYKKALNAINIAITLKPNNFKAMDMKVSILGLLGRYKDAAIVADEALALNLDDGLFFRKGVSLYHSREFNDSIKAFDECLKMNPNHEEATIKKISALTLTRRYSEAISLYDSSDLPKLEDSTLENNIGFSLINIGENERAETELKKALLSDINHEISATIYLNLFRLKYITKDYKMFIYYLYLHIISSIKAHILFYKKHKKIDRHVPKVNKYNGPGSLFSSHSQLRELKAIWKIFDTPFFWFLCNDTFDWFAVNIPLDLLGNNKFKGDIDLLVSMPRHIPSNNNTSSRYRAFEVKSVSVNRGGVVKSSKRGKHKKIFSQLNKLKKFGCEQIFLLELYVIERGYSDSQIFPNKEITEEIESKRNNFISHGFGYVTIAQEPSPYFNEHSGGISHMPINVLPAKDQEVESAFSDLTKYIDEFYKKEISNYNENRKFPVVSYCNKCKQLIMLYTDDYSFNCPDCGKKIY